MEPAPVLVDAVEESSPTLGVESAAPALRVWVDIENPPQVQYLLPLVRGFANSGADVVVSARDYGIAHELLRKEGVDFHPVGRHFGPSLRAKVVGNLGRAWTLRRWLRRTGKPDVVVSASRSAALAARSLGIPSFVVCDYEWVNMSAFRYSGTYILHPDVIARETFYARGIRPDRLIAFPGIKEAVTFADVDAEHVAPASFPQLNGAQRTRVLFRPPAEESHYHRQESSDLAQGLLEQFAARDDCVVLFSPRYPWQVDAVNALEWRAQPVVVDQAVSFMALYKAVDVVISGGGTMTREAAYLGVPAISVFRGLVAEVDRHLESLGRLTILSEPAELARLDLGTLRPQPPMGISSQVRDEVVREISERVPSRNGKRTGTG